MQPNSTRLQVAAVAAGAPSAAVPAVLAAVSEAMAASPHVEFLLTWVQALCLRHDVAHKVPVHACGCMRCFTMSCPPSVSRTPAGKWAARAHL